MLQPVRVHLLDPSVVCAGGPAPHDVCLPSCTDDPMLNLAKAWVILAVHLAGQPLSMLQPVRVHLLVLLPWPARVHDLCFLSCKCNAMSR